MIINVSSIGGVYANSGAAYSEAKAVVKGLTKNIALQYSGTRIRWKAVYHGPLPSELNIPEQMEKFGKEFMEICARYTDPAKEKMRPLTSPTQSYSGQL